MCVFSTHEVLSGSVVFYCLMPLSSDVRLQYSRGLAKGSCVLQFNASIVRCSSSVVAGFSQG